MSVNLIFFSIKYLHLPLIVNIDEAVMGKNISQWLAKRTNLIQGTDDGGNVEKEEDKKNTISIIL